MYVYMFTDVKPAKAISAKEYARFTTCDACVAAGHGWSDAAEKCGNFANKDCGDEEDEDEDEEEEDEESSKDDESEDDEDDDIDDEEEAPAPSRPVSRQ